MINKMTNTKGYTEEELKDLRDELRDAGIALETVAKKARVSANYPARIFTGVAKIENWNAAEKARRVVKAAKTLLANAA